MSKKALAIIGSTIFSGGVLGVTHYGAPDVLWKTGLACKVVEIEETDKSKLPKGLYMDWKIGYSSFSNAKKDGGDSAYCYKY